MDPWLERSHHWPNFHSRLINEIDRSLSSQLGPRYFVSIEERVYVLQGGELDDFLMIADVQLAELVHRDSASGQRAEAEHKHGDTVVAEPFVTVTQLETEIHETRLVIEELPERTAVTVIEVLSPANKHPGPGFDSYARKRKATMNSNVNLVEVDLLRGRNPFLPRGRRHWHYSIHVSRAKDRPDGTIWPIKMQQKLPVFQVPLAGDDAEVAVDLQTAFTDAFNRGQFNRVLDYARDPAVPLEPNDAVWADRLLRMQNLR